MRTETGTVLRFEMSTPGLWPLRVPSALPRLHGAGEAEPYVAARRVLSPGAFVNQVVLAAYDVLAVRLPTVPEGRLQDFLRWSPLVGLKVSAGPRAGG